MKPEPRRVKTDHSAFHRNRPGRGTRRLVPAGDSGGIRVLPTCRGLPRASDGPAARGGDLPLRFGGTRWDASAQGVGGFAAET